MVFAFTATLEVDALSVELLTGPTALPAGATAKVFVLVVIAALLGDGVGLDVGTTAVGDGEGDTEGFGEGEGSIKLGVDEGGGEGEADAVTVSSTAGTNPPPPPPKKPPPPPPPINGGGSEVLDAVGVAVTLTDGEALGSGAAVGVAVILTEFERGESVPDPTPFFADTRAVNVPIVRLANVANRLAISVIVWTAASTPSLTKVTV